MWLFVGICCSSKLSSSPKYGRLENMAGKYPIQKGKEKVAITHKWDCEVCSMGHWYSPKLDSRISIRKNMIVGWSWRLTLWWETFRENLFSVYRNRVPNSSNFNFVHELTKKSIFSSVSFSSVVRNVLTNTNLLQQNICFIRTQFFTNSIFSISTYAISTIIKQVGIRQFLENLLGCSVEFTAKCMLVVFFIPINISFA